MKFNHRRKPEWLDWERIQIISLTVVLGFIPILIFNPDLTWISRLFIMFLIFAIIATGLNIVFGHTDQLYLFLGGLLGIATYGTMITATRLDISPWLTWLPFALIVGGIGFFVSYVCARRKLTVILIAIVTLSLQLAIVEVFVGARDWTGGTTGMRYSGFELEIVQNTLGLTYHQTLFYFVFLIFVAVTVFYHWLRHSKYGFAFALIRQDEFAAASIGVNVVRFKSLAGFFGAFTIGLIGPFYGQLERLILPSMFSFTSIDVVVLIMLMIGGFRTLLGPVVGAGVLIYINEELLHGIGQWRLTIFGILLIVLFLYFRQGLVPFIGQHITRLPSIVRRISNRLRLS